MPPTSTVTTDSVSTLRPFASSAKSMPLAFQKREAGVTNWSKGAFTKTPTITSLPSFETSVDTTCPADTPRK